MAYQLAQVNVARMIGTSLEDPIMKEFTTNLDKVNELAESAPGFVWRWKDEAENSGGGVFIDSSIIVNISVWEDVETLETFTYKTFHAQFVRRRKEFFCILGRHTMPYGGPRKVHFRACSNARKN